MAFYVCSPIPIILTYYNVPQFSDRQAWANSIDPDQTAQEQSDQLLFHPHLLDACFYGKNILLQF